MTNNKLEVKRYDCTSGGAQYCYGCYTMEEDELGYYVEWEAYEALQAECEKLRKDVAGLVEALENATRSLRTISKKAGIDEFMSEMCEVRGYAESRAWCAEKALAAHRKGDDPDAAIDAQLGAVRKYTRQDLQNWRDDALEAAAKICDRYGLDACGAGHDIRAMKHKENQDAPTSTTSRPLSG